MPEMRTNCNLVLIVVTEERLLQKLITGFVDLGVGGATVVEGKGMGQIISNQLPIFAGLASLFPPTAASHLIFSVVLGDKVEAVFSLVREVMNNAGLKQGAVCFSLPVDRVQGIAFSGD